MSQFSATHRDSRTPTPTSSPPHDGKLPHKPDSGNPHNYNPQPHPLHLPHNIFPSLNTTPIPPAPSSPVRGEYAHSPISQSPTASPRGSRRRSNSRPLSMVQAYNPPVMDVNEDTIPELQPIFTF